jgi:exopolysaccharide production protein ExoQ
MIDRYAILPILGIVYAAIVSQLIIFVTDGYAKHGAWAGLMPAHPENRYFWFGLAAISIMSAMQNWSRLAKFTWPPHLICLFAYVALAGASVIWAFKPEYSFARFILQTMIIVSTVVPIILAARTVDLMRCLFLCFGLASIMNIPFVLNQDPIFVMGQNIGYPGFFTNKGVLGECASIALLLALHEMLYPGLRRAMAVIVIIVAIWLTFVSHSKGSLGFAIIAPLTAAFALIAARTMRISVAAVLLSIPVCYTIFSKVTGLTMNKLSWYAYGNYDFSGREIIWYFANNEIQRRPLLGWGYQSFWLVGPDAPSIVDAPGWVKAMPSAHSGYLDVKLELGYIGFAVLLSFILTTLHAIGRVADRERARAWLMLSLALYIILTNFLETTWARGMETLWIIFVIVAAEAGRYWQPFPSGDRSRYLVGRSATRNGGAARGRPSTQYKGQESASLALPAGRNRSGQNLR